MNQVKNANDKNNSNVVATKKNVFSAETLNTLNKIEISESVQRKKDFLYKFQLSEVKLSDKDAKKKRSKLRHELQRIVNNLIVLAKTTQNVEEMQKEKNNLIAFQKENLINTDFKCSSFYQGSEEKKTSEINAAIIICNELK